MRPRTILPPAGPSLTRMMRSSRHSKEIGEPATWGGRTWEEGLGETWNRSNSLSPWGREAAVSFMALQSRVGTRLTTNSPVSSTLRSVSLGRPKRSLTGQKSRVGGLAQTPMKKLNGARFVRPWVSSVETQAMGRGEDRVDHPLVHVADGEGLGIEMHGCG